MRTHHKETLPAAFYESGIKALSAKPTSRGSVQIALVLMVHKKSKVKSNEQ
jgi:hypothetical protein